MRRTRLHDGVYIQNIPPILVAQPPEPTFNEVIERDERAGLEEELARLRAENEALKAAAPTPLPPNPEEARLSDYGEVGTQVPDELSALMEPGETIAEAKARITPLLWVERAELRQLQGRKGENLKRESEIEYLLGLLARLGDS